MRSLLTQISGLYSVECSSSAIKATRSVSFFSKKKLIVSHSFFHFLFFLVTLFMSATGLAQKKPPPPPPTTPGDCKIGCTSNDVQIIRAYLSDANGNKLGASFICPQDGDADVYLTLELTTNTPRVGVVIYGQIWQWDAINNKTVGTLPLDTKSECFGDTLNKPTNKVTFKSTFNWTCGTPIAFTKVFIGWGTGNTNFCTGTVFQCPATSSKCFQLPDDQAIGIETPSTHETSQTKCSTVPGGTTAIFDLKASDNDVKGSQTNVTVTWYSDAASTTELTDAGDGSTDGKILVTKSDGQVVYAKVCSTISPFPCSAPQAVTLHVNQTPNLTITDPAAVCSPNTVDLTATAITNGSTLPTGTTLSYWTNFDGTGAVSDATKVGAGTYYIKAATNTTPSCSDIKSVVVTVKTKPGAPTLGKVDNCDGTSTITATDLADGATLTWSDGGSGNPRTVSSTTALTVTQTVDGCTSDNSNSVTPAPKTAPNAPVLSKVDHCDGTTTITAKDGDAVIAATELTWSNGATTNPINVTSTAAITATRTVNGCTSDNSSSVTPAPGTSPSAPSVTYNYPACYETTFSVTITGVISGATYTIKDKNGADISGVLPSKVITAVDGNDIIFSNIPAGSGYQVTVKVGDCPSTASSCGMPVQDPNRIAAKNTQLYAEESELKVTAYPNPFSDKINFVVNAPVSGKGTLEVYNSLGQKIKTVYQGTINKGTQNFELRLPVRQQANLIYVLRVGGKQLSGKILQLNQ